MSEESPTEESVTPPAPNRRRTAILIGVIVAIIAVVAIVTALAFAAGNSSPSPSTTPSGSSTRATSPATTSSASPSPSAAPVATASPTPTVTEDPAVPNGVVVTAPDQPANPSAALTVALVSTTAIQATADEPGEIAGPAIRAVISIKNNTDATISLQSTVVNADYGSDRTPAGEASQAEDTPISGDVAPGETITGSYVFTIPADQRDNVRISVFTSVDNPTVVFEGPVAR